ncbi:AraC family transcriptional regulator [Galbibacter orientalis]|uniref:helix-turn-helix domain-containing protein n=1 Tax=Galbibacter orientalis TaxID=453852 RepID=UPI00308099BD
MKKIIIKDNSLEEVFSQIKSKIGGTISNEEGIVSFSSNSDHHIGEIKGSCYSNSISFIKCKLSLSEDIIVHLQPNYRASFLYFVYCNKGKFLHKYKNNNLYRPIHPHQTVVINSGAKGVTLVFKKEQLNEIIFIKINPLIYLRKEKFGKILDKNIQFMYSNFDTIEGYTHYGSYNLKLAENFNRIDNIQGSGFVKKIYLEGQIKLLLALLIKQYTWDVQNKDTVFELTNSELRKIREISEYIKKFPSKSHSIKKLTTQYFISPSKLQKGFKIMHDRTVADFIKNLRIELAEEMIKNRECTISEIVYDIGFTSRSYFSKIFKEKYHCSPKNYQEKLKLNFNIS